MIIVTTLSKGMEKRPEENAINVNNDCVRIKRIIKPLPLDLICRNIYYKH